MTRSEFSQALKLAQSDKDLSQVDDEILHGCGLASFVPVVTTLEIIAKFLRWHVIYLNGQIDSEALDEMRAISKKKWLLV